MITDDDKHIIDEINDLTINRQLLFDEFVRQRSEIKSYQICWFFSFTKYFTNKIHPYVSSVIVYKQSDIQEEFKQAIHDLIPQLHINRSGVRLTTGWLTGDDHDIPYQTMLKIDEILQLSDYNVRDPR